ncbi:MAG: metallophosphoesterase family protein [Acidobacteriota bacterium]
MGQDFTLLHISDLHFGLKDKRECFLPAVGDKVLAVADALRPDALVVSGDLSIRALPEELERAAAYLARFQVPARIVIPGNHDARGDAGLANFERIIGPTEPSLPIPGAMLVGVDSTEEDAEEAAKGAERTTIGDWEKALRMSKGFVGSEQYLRIAQDVHRAASGDVRIIVMHHHLVGIPGTGIDTDPLIDSGDLLHLYLKWGIHLVLAGHKHRPWLWDVNGLRILHCGTSTSNRYKSGVLENFYNVIRMRDGVLSAERVALSTGAVKKLFSGPLTAPMVPEAHHE